MTTLKDMSNMHKGTRLMFRQLFKAIRHDENKPAHRRVFTKASVAVVVFEKANPHNRG